MRPRTAHRLGPDPSSSERPVEPVVDTSAPSPPRRARRTDVLGLAWVLAAAGALLAPALAHGTALGTFDVLSVHGLTKQPGTVVHYSGPSDQIQMLIPWTTLAWTQVHHAQLPLWNPYSALGMPLAFNWQSATLSLPSLVGYLVPLHLAYTVGVLVTLAVAGTGVYVFGRVLGLSVWGCVMAATAFELSGPFVGWLGWPVAGVLSLSGWMFAAALLVVRGRRRTGAIALLAVVVAFTIYAGQPETAVELVVALVVFLAVVLTLRAVRRTDPAPVRRPVVDLVLAVAAGAALGAPLLLPGLQVASGSVRRVAGSYGTLPAHDLAHVLFQGFDGLPVAGSQWFGHSIYPESAAYVGVIVVVLAVMGVARERARPEMIALGAVVVVAAALVFVAPVVSVLDELTRVRSAAWHRAVGQLVFALAVLAGVGTDVLVRAPRARATRGWLGGGFAVTGAVLAALWLEGRGRLPHAEAVLRARSFLWPVIDTAVGLAVVALVVVVSARSGGHHRAGSGRFGRFPGAWAAAALVAAETAFLVVAGAPLVSSSPSYPAPTRAVVDLQRAVGTSTVAFGAQLCSRQPTLGILPDANILDGVHELAVYDPMTPLAYFRTWRAQTGRPGAAPGAPLVFCPAVTSASTARRYGAGFVLEPSGAPAPRGARYDRRVGDEDLYAVPGATEASMVAVGARGAPPGLDTTGTAVPVTHLDPATWTLTTRAAHAVVLRLRVTDVPGWHAAVDGRALDLQPVNGVMLQARIGPGRHTVELHYWPTTFTVGLILAGASVVMLVGAGVVSRIGRRRAR